MKNILVIRFSSLGDVILTTGVLKFISEKFPHVKISVLTLKPFSNVFNGLSFVETVYTISKSDRLRDYFKLAQSMPAFDAIFDLHANLRSNILKRLIKGKVYTYQKNSLMRRLFVKFRIGRNLLQEHTIQKYFKPFGYAFNIECPNIEALRPFLSVSPNIPETASLRAVIHPFASKPTKEWGYVKDLCEILVSKGYKVQVIGNGSIELPDGVDNKTGVLPFETLKNIIASADIFFTTDSGPLHIATALNVKTVAVFGPTTKELGFYPTFHEVAVVENMNLKCRPCHVHGGNSCPKNHFQCMKSITAEYIAKKYF